MYQPQRQPQQVIDAVIIAFALTWTIFHGMNIVHGVALSLLMAWCALWFELAMGIADTYYLRVYEKYYQDQHGAETTEDTPSSATEPQKDAVPKL